MNYILILDGDPIGIYSSFFAAQQSAHKRSEAGLEVEIMAVPYYGEGSDND